MSTATNFPEATIQPTPKTRSTKFKNLAIGSLAIAVVALGGYTVYDLSLIHISEPTRPY